MSRRAATQERREGAQRLSPRPVTRGESPEQGAKVDWLNVTFLGTSTTPEAFIADLASCLGRPVRGVEGRGLLGFSQSIDLRVGVGSRVVDFGKLAMGGESQGGRWMLQIPGHGCGLVEDWHALKDLLEELPESRITRLDLAVDFLEGEHDVDEALALYREGSFTSSGRAPSARLQDDLGSGEGRTVYIGKAVNGKTLRVYEKGRQLGDPDATWVRWEVQFGNRDRVIPWAALVLRDKFFAGAYPALASMVSDAACHIETVRTEGVISLEHLFRHLRRSYGKAVGVLTDFGIDPSELVECVSVIGAPRRLDPSCLAAGVETADVLAAIERARA